MQNASMTFTQTGPDALLFGLWRDLNARGNKIYNLEDGVQPQDATTFGQLTAEAEARAEGDDGLASTVNVVNNGLAAEIATRKAAVDALNASMSSLAAGNLPQAGIVPGGQGGILRSVYQVILDRPPNAAWYGLQSGAPAAECRAALNRAFAANRAVFVAPGYYAVDGPLKAQSAGRVCGEYGFDATRIVRRGSWAGNTLEFGRDLPGQGSYNFVAEDIRFEQEHPGFIPGTSTSFTDKAMGGHILVFGGTNGQIRRCWFSYGSFGVWILGGTNIRLEDNHVVGSWDDGNSALCEMDAAIRVTNSPRHGIATCHKIIGNYLGGIPTVTRTLTDGAATWQSHQDGGPAYGVLVEGCEGIVIADNYLGGNNKHTLRLAPNAPNGYSILGSVRIRDNFFDACTLYSISIDSVDGNFATMVSIHHNEFNGQLQAQGVLDVDGADQRVRGLNFSHNITQAHLRTPLRLMGAYRSSIHGNIIGAYNCRNGGTTKDFASGALVGGVAREQHFANNQWGGDINTFANQGNNCKWGAYFDGEYGSAMNERALLGMAGGAVVAGISQTYPT